jgi:protein SCO1
MKNTLIFYLLFLLAASFAAVLFSGCNQKPAPALAAPAGTEADTGSLYQFTGEWHDQQGDTLQLSRFAGKIPVVAMVFTRCAYACGRIVADIRNIEKQVPADKKDQVVFVLVSFDSERDQPAQLKEFAAQMQLEGDNWVLLHGNEAAVRELSMLLDVKYKKQPNGDFAHSNSITLLNTRGAIAARTEGLGVNVQPILDKMMRL